MTLNSFQLKLIAMFFMVLDHVYSYLNQVGKIDIPIWFGYLGKISAPIFFYLIVEGFFHTKSRANYMKRLFLFGIIMVIVDLIVKISNNIFLSLALSVGLMSVIEYCKVSKNYLISTLLAIGVIIASLFTEASIYGVGMTLIFYFFRECKVKLINCYMIYSLLPIVSALSFGSDFKEAIFLWDYQWMMVFATPFLIMYNGKLGLSNQWTKWMFYIFYPLHLIVIVLLKNYIGVM